MLRRDFLRFRSSSLTNLAAVAGIVLSAAQTASAQETKIFSGHNDPVYALSFTPDGKSLVTGSFDKSLKLWDVATQKTLRTMPGHTEIVLAVAVSPDGTQIASGSLDRTIRLWDVPINAPLGNLAGHQGAVYAVAVNADGSFYISGGADKTIKVWNAADGKPVRDVAGNTAEIRRLDFRRDNQQIASADATGLVRLFKADDGTPQGTLGAHISGVTGLAYAPNNSFLLTAGADGLVKRWPNNPPLSRSVTGHEGAIHAMRLSPNAARIATGAADKTARIWNFGDGKQLFNLEGHGGEVTTVAFSNNSAQLATGCADKIPRLFDANNGQSIKEFPALAAGVAAVAISPDNQFLVAGDSAGGLKLFKTADATEVAAPAGSQGAINGLAYLANGQQIFSTSAGDKVVRVWNGTDGSAVKTIETADVVTGFSLRPDGAQLAVAGNDKGVRIYNVGDDKLVATLTGHAGKVTSIDFSRDNKRLLTADEKGIAHSWDIATGVEEQFFANHQGAVAAVAFSNDNKTILTAGADKTVQIDSVSVQFAVAADPKQVHDLAISSNNAQYATAGESGEVKMWNTGNGSEIRAYSGHEGPALSVALSPNNQQVAAGGKDKSLMIWNAGNSAIEHQIETPAEVTRVAYSADSNKLIAAGSDNAIRSYNPERPNPQPSQPPSQEPAQVMSGHTAAIQALQFTPDNRTALTASADGTVKTWSVAAATFTANLGGHGSQIYGLTFSPDGKTLASASNDKTVRLWDVAEKRQIKTLSTQPAGVYGVAFSPDGKSLATSGADKSVRLFNLETGTQSMEFQGAEYAIYSVAFSPDGKSIAAGGVGLGDNRQVLLWNIDNAQPARIFAGHKDDVYRVQFSPSGSRLLTAGYSGIINVWDAASAKPLFTQDMPIVLYSATYSPDGKQIGVCANDGKAYLLDVPDSAQ